MKPHLLLAILFTGTALTAQAPVKTGSISGRVIDADTKAPLAGVQVGSREIGRVATDANGRYLLTNVMPGDVGVWVQESNGGYLDMTLTPPRKVVVNSGQETSGIDFRVRLDARISGRVLNENGEPIQGIRVSIVEQIHASDDNLYGVGELAPRSGRTVTTDDRGAFAFDNNVFAGHRYWILALPSNRYSGPISDAPTDPAARSRVLAPTYYPNANSLENATSVVLHSLEHRSDIEIRMRSVPSYCIEATLNAGGTPARMRFGIQDELLPVENLQITGVPPGGGESADDGKIRVCSHYSGRFRLTAAQAPESNSTLTRYIGALPFTIAEADVTGLKLTTAPPVTISGEIVWDSTPPELPFKPEIVVSQSPRAPALPNIRSGVPGEFSFLALPTVPYNLRVFTGVPRGTPAGITSSLYVKEITYGGESVLYRPIKPEDGNGKLRIVLGHDAGSLAVTVTGSAGVPSAGSVVMIIPAGAQNENELAMRMRSGSTNGSGTYTATGVPPGRYYVLATDDPPLNHTLLPSEIPSETVTIIKNQDNLSLLLRAKSTGQLVDVGPRSAVQVRVSPRALK